MVELDNWIHKIYSFLFFALSFNLSHLFVQIVEQEESTKECHIKATSEQAQLVTLAYASDT